MTDLVIAGGHEPALPEQLGSAAARFARIMLRHSEDTQRTYSGVYRRFAAFVADRDGVDEAPIQAFTADALADYLDAREDAGAAPSTVKKDRAALNSLAKYLHTIGAIDATEILMVPVAVDTDAEIDKRDALDEQTWRRVKAAARARLAPGPRARASRPAALRDLAMLLLLGDVGLRSGEVRTLPRHDSLKLARDDGSRPWLHILGKGRRKRRVPLPLEVEEAIAAWLAVRDELYEPYEDDAKTGEPLMFPALGRPRVDGTFTAILDRRPGRRLLSHEALIDVVRPLMMAAGVPHELAIPHVLRHTYGTLYMRRPGAKLEDLRTLMGHASISTTLVYHHHRDADLLAAVAANEAHAADALALSAQRREQRAAARRRR